MTGRRQRQRGQASVEFVLAFVALLLCLALVIQFTWIAVQKWQFNHFANYTARVWSVRTGDSAGMAMLYVLGSGLMRWDTLNRDYVKLMWVSGEETQTVHNGFEEVSADGLAFTGVTTLMPLFRPFIGGATLISTAEIPGEILSLFPISIPPLGIVRFETFIPMSREPEEGSGGGQKYDNDCEETPCEEPNGR